MADGDATYAVGCAKCGATENLKRCARCKQILYCSREHQKQHWKYHKVTCMQLSNTPDTAPNCVAENDNGDVCKFTNNCNTNSAQVINASEASGERVASNNECASDNSKERKEVDENKDFVEFDTTPYVYQVFDKPPSDDLDVLAKFATDCLKRDGYCVVDGLFKEEEINNALKESGALLSDCKLQQGQIAGGRTSGIKELMDSRTEIRNDKILWIVGTEPELPGCCKVVHTMDSLLSRFNQHLRSVCCVEGRTKAMVAVYPGNGSFYRRHIDNPNKDGRAITCILYLNKYWHVQDHGGLLRIFPKDSKNFVDVAPLANRLLLFWSDGRNPHEVQPTFRTRYAITVWYFDKGERRQAREEERNEELMRVAGEMALLEVEEKYQAKKAVEKKMEAEVSKGIQALAKDELEVFAVLLRDEPDPRSILTSLGVTQALVQDALLKQIKAFQLEKMDAQEASN